MEEREEETEMMFQWKAHGNWRRAVQYQRNNIEVILVCRYCLLTFYFINAIKDHVCQIVPSFLLKLVL